MEIMSFTCDFCGKIFAYKFNLNKHVRRTHTGEKLRRCRICGATFSFLSSLKTHRMTHTVKMSRDTSKKGAKPAPKQRRQQSATSTDGGDCTSVYLANESVSVTKKARLNKAVSESQETRITETVAVCEKDKTSSSIQGTYINDTVSEKTRHSETSSARKPRLIKAAKFSKEIRLREIVSVNQAHRVDNHVNASCKSRHSETGNVKKTSFRSGDMGIRSVSKGSAITERGKEEYDNETNVKYPAMGISLSDDGVSVITYSVVNILQHYYRKGYKPDLNN